ncbi:MAG: hypothetical protein D6800_12615, partial [Candidatus Zixiibacteriota bacterium]
KARCEVVVPDTVAVGEPFEVGFIFEALEPLHFDTAHPHTARIVAPSNAVFISGDTLWTGRLRQGVPQSLRAVFKLDSARVCRFIGRLITAGAESSTGHNSGVQGYGYRHVNGATSKLIYPVGYSKTRRQPVLHVTDSGVTVTNTSVAPTFCGCVSITSENNL